MPAHLIAEDGPQRGLILDFTKGEVWTVGRDPDGADFVIEDSTVSRKHARFTKSPEGIFVKNLSRVNPTLVNDQEFKDPILLVEGDRIQIGNTRFLFSEEAFSEQKKPESKYDDIFGDLGMPEEPAAEPPAPEPEVSQPTAYDTIFEEGAEEEPLPFNLISSAPYLLKVIAGPNAGAEIGMDKGRSYVLGKDPNTCDIVFHDMSVSRNHARLSVNADGIMEIEDLDSKNGTVVNGSVIKEKTAITPQDLVALGTTIFLIIDREAPQETIYSPIAPSYEPQRAAEEPLKEPAAVAEPVTDWKKEPIPMKYWVSGGSVAAVFLIVFLSFFSLFKSKGIEVVQKEPVKQIQEALAKFEAVQFSFNPGSGKLFLVGHVLTAVDYQEMKYRIDQIPFIASTEDTVVIDEYVDKSMNDVLSANGQWKGVSIQSPTPGKFVATGYLMKNTSAAELNDYLTVNFPYLDRLQNKVVVEENLNTELQSLIAVDGLGGVTFQLNNGEVILQGRYSEKKESQYEALIKTLNALPGVQSVKSYAVATHPDQAGIDLSQQYQVSGLSTRDGKGFSVVLNGKIYTIGDKVEGMTVTSINQNTILLEKDGLKYKIDTMR